MLTALKPAVGGAFAGSFATVAVARGLQSTLFGVRADSLSLYLLVFACVTLSVAIAALLGARALHRLSIVDALRD